LGLGLFAVLPAAAVDHSGVITANETWFAADNPHNVVASVTVESGVTLTIEAGAEVQFTGNTILSVSGVLLAIGTQGTEIHFSGATTLLWSGLRFRYGGAGIIAHCLIENAGTGIRLEASGAVNLTDTTIRNSTYGIHATSSPLSMGGVTLINLTYYGFVGSDIAPILLDSNNVIDNCDRGFFLEDVPDLIYTTPLTIRNCASYGIHLENCESPILDNLIFENNSGLAGAMILQDCGEFTFGPGLSIGGLGVENTWPVTIRGGSYPSADCEIPTSGNLNNDIRINGGSMTNDCTWHSFPNLDYIIDTPYYIQPSGVLTIEDGVAVRFLTTANIKIYGALTAVGTSGNGILFTGTTDTGSGQLRFVNDGGGTLAHCSFEHTMGLNVETSGTVSVASTTIRDGTLAGIEASSGTIELESVTVSNHTYGFSGEGVVPTLLDSSTVFENCSNGIRLDGCPDLDLTMPVIVRNCTYAGIYLIDCESPTLDNLTVQHCDGDYGAILLHDCGEFTLGSDNAIGGAEVENTWAVTVDIGSFPGPDCVVSAEGNDNAGIQVIGGTTDRVVTWRLLDTTDLIVTGTPTIAPGGELVIAPGMTPRFALAQGLEIEGTLTALGTAESSIVFTDAGAGSWAGLMFVGSGNGNLAHCRVEHGGQGLHLNTTDTVSMASVTISSGVFGLYIVMGDVVWSDLTIIDQSSHGLYSTGSLPTLLDDDTVFDGCGTGLYIANVPDLVFSTPIEICNSTRMGLHLNNCRSAYVDSMILKNNAGLNGAVFMQSCGEFTLGSGNLIGGEGFENSLPLTIDLNSFPSANCVIPTTGNMHNYIRVKGGNSSDTVPWRFFPGLSYVIDNGGISVLAGGELTIASGVEVRINNNNSINIRGALTAIGQLDAPITFVANHSLWTGIRFLDDGAGTLEHCQISGAFRGVYTSSNGRIDLISTTIQECTNGVDIANGTMSFQNDRIVDNLGYGIRITGGAIEFGTDLSGWNDIYGNGLELDTYDFLNGPDDVDVSWVHWGTLDPLVIEEHILDQCDNGSLGRVEYRPFTDETHEVVVAVSDDEISAPTLPDRTAVLQNHPNPFNPTTTICFELHTQTPVRVQVYNVAGALVSTLVDRVFAAGRHSSNWDGTDDRGQAMPSGVYLYRFTAGDHLETRRMLLMR